MQSLEDPPHTSLRIKAMERLLFNLFYFNVNVLV